MPSAWTLLRAALDPLARAYGYYMAYTIGHDEYVGALGDGYTLRDARKYLRQNDYEPQYLSAAKRLPVTGELHDLSYRRVPTAHPDEWSDPRFAPEECQYHVHVWQSDGGPLFFSHYETRPDRVGTAVEHYRPTPGRTYLRGVTDLEL